MKYCPKCETTFEGDARFCDQCGALLQEQEEKSFPAGEQKKNEGEGDKLPPSPSPSPSRSPFSYETIAAMVKNKESAPAPAPGNSDLAGSPFAGNQNQGWDLAARSREIAESFSHRGSSTPPQDPGNPYIKVEYRKNIFFLAGMQVPFELRITILDPAVKKVSGWFSPQTLGEKNTLYEIPVESRLSTGSAMELFIPYLPPDTLSGMIPFHFYFACQIDGENKFYHMVNRHQVYPRNASSESVINNISITASEAGSISSNIKDLLQSRAARSAEDLLDSLNKMSSSFTVEKLEETLWRPENTIAQGRPFQCEKLTMMIKNHHYQIVGKKNVKLGRLPDQNDIAIVDMIQADDLKSYPNSTISRQHAEIHYCGDTVNLFDKSTYGTYINSSKPTDKGIPIPNEAIMEFGDIHWNMEMQHCEICPEAPLCKCCPAEKIKSICFTRRDNVPESYLLVWECCELGYLHSEFSGMTVIRRNGEFILKMPDGKYYHMAPGLQLSWNDVKISILNFKQFKL